MSENMDRTSNERVSDKRLTELVSHYENVDKQHNGWWVAVYWCLRELQERRSADETTCSAADYEEVLADHRRLVRELDVLLNGEHGAAKQASLCDIVGQLRTRAPSREVFDRYPVGTLFQKKSDGRVLAMTPDSSGTVIAIPPEEPSPVTNSSGSVSRPVDVPALAVGADQPTGAAALEAGTAHPPRVLEEDVELDLACEEYIEDPHSRFCDRCGYPEREHRRTGSREKASGKHDSGCVYYYGKPCDCGAENGTGDGV